MKVSLNGKLNALADSYYIKYGSNEQKKIDTSVSTLKERLKLHFGSDVQSLIEFGSYKRDTILPRQHDEHSDVDLMIVFNHAQLSVNPGTYRNYLIDFAEKRYSRSNVFKSSPTVVLELDHIKYDLVPTHIQSNIWNGTTYHIPKSDTSWMTTDPTGFDMELTRANGNHSYNIKKVIRLLKAWNAKAGYPLASYELEQQVTRMGYYFIGNTSLESYFFTAINDLNSYPNGYNIPKIDALKENARKVRAYLDVGNIELATNWLSHILPM